MIIGMRLENAKHSECKVGKVKAPPPASIDLNYILIIDKKTGDFKNVSILARE